MPARATSASKLNTAVPRSSAGEVPTETKTSAEKNRSVNVVNIVNVIEEDRPRSRVRSAKQLRSA